MANVHLGSSVPADQQREMLYRGDLVVLPPSNASLQLCALADELLCEAFSPYDPETAQESMSVEDYAAVLAKCKPSFIHHPRAKELIPQILDAAECDLDKMYFDVPRLRTSTSDGYLTSGIAYAFHPHRDTWYSAPQCQINWWMPVRPISSDNCMSIFPDYFNRAIDNSSHTYNYYRWNKESRSAAAKQIGKDTRVQPRPEEDVNRNSELRLVPEVGSLILFAGSHLHASVENISGRTRLSIDFRTVHEDDVREMKGAPNADSSCTGTTLRDFMRCTDLRRLPDALIAPYDIDDIPEDSVLIHEVEGKEQAS